MAPKLVAPYRLSGKRGKNDAADAAAICEAVTRAQMRFVPIKSIEQQGQLMVPRARQGFVEQRTATFNRRLLAPYREWMRGLTHRDKG
jgi:transposase